MRLLRHQPRKVGGILGLAGLGRVVLGLGGLALPCLIDSGAALVVYVRTHKEEIWSEDEEVRRERGALSGDRGMWDLSEALRPRSKGPTLNLRTGLSH